MKIYDKNIKEILDKLKSRQNIDSSNYLAIVKEIVKNVREKGDEALISYTNKFDSDKITVDNIKVTKEEILEGYNNLSEELKNVYRLSAERIKKFHTRQLRDSWQYEENGEILGQRIMPLESVGVYVPGGKAAYPSTVFMNVVPALVAGVKNIIMTTPCNKEGKVLDTVLGAAYILGIENIYKIGGAQAIGALAYGTNTIPKVDKIVGPGNIFVALAKKEVFGSVSIDSVAGPSEILVIADEYANPRFVAADLLSQAEHDELASSILITNSLSLANETIKEIDNFTKELSRKDIINKSLENYGGIILVDNLEEAADISNQIAPEHLELYVKEPFKLLDSIKNAGAIFLGEYAPESLGDYMAGPNHVLPTNRTARFFSPLNIDDYTKKSSIISFSKEAFQRLGDSVCAFAESEGLTAHALASSVRMEKK